MPASSPSIETVVPHNPLRRKLSRTARVSEVPIHTTLPRQLAERLFFLADRDSSTIAGITRRAIVNFVKSQNLEAGVSHG